jgi:hypothetical protein
VADTGNTNSRRRSTPSDRTRSSAHPPIPSAPVMAVMMMMMMVVHHPRRRRGVGAEDVGLGGGGGGGYGQHQQPPSQHILERRHSLASSLHLLLLLRRRRPSDRTRSSAHPPIPSAPVMGLAWHEMGKRTHWLPSLRFVVRFLAVMSAREHDCAYRHLPLLPPSAAAAATTASLRSHSVQRPSSHHALPAWLGTRWGNAHIGSPLSDLWCAFWR